MNTKEIQAWRTIVAILRETGYDKLYDEEIHIVVECLRRCKKQKELINKIYELIKQHIRKDEFLELNEWQTRELLDILNEVKE